MDDKRLRPFQIKGEEKIDYFCGRTLLADEQGLGKTVQSLSWLNHQDHIAFPAVVVCKSSGKLKWIREVNKWVAGATCKGLFGQTSYRDLSRHDILVTNWDILPHHVDVIRKYGAKTVILDECQMMKEWDAKRTQAAFEVAIPADYVIAISGTPMINRPLELYNVLWLLRPDLFPDRLAFKNRYCGRKKSFYGVTYDGLSNARELHEILVNNLMIRRLKRDVLPELPPVQYSTVPLDIDQQEHDRVMAGFDEWLVNASTRQRFAQKMVHREYARQASAFSKLTSAIEWIDDFLEEGRKLVVFAWHVDVIKTLVQHYGNIAVHLHGTSTKKDAAVQQFQNNSKYRLALANMDAAGDTIDLTAASDAAFLEFPDTPTSFYQCVARVYGRLNDLHGAMIHLLVTPNSIEEKIATMLADKDDKVSQVIDGQEGIDSIFSQLLNQYYEEEMK